MENHDISKKLDEMSCNLEDIRTPENKKLLTLAEKTRESQDKLKNSLDKLQESLDYLRLVVKYQMFDLEATRRENQMLRDMLEDRRKNLE